MGTMTVYADGVLVAAGQRYRCALGPAGVVDDKREGDGATPAGAYPLRRVHYRPDVFASTPVTGLPIRALSPQDGWCDDPGDPAYNTLVTLPHEASHERLWRDDALYDIVVEIGFNDDPPVPGLGSAIFMHIARPEYAPTEGCVALAREDLIAVLETLDAGDTVNITSPTSIPV